MKLIILLICLFSFTSFAEIDSLSIQDKTVLEIVNGKEIFQSESDWWDKYSSGLIAAFTVIISLGISVWQARKTTKATRANSISEARIQWIQELRPLMSKLISDSSKLVSIFSNLSQFVDPKTKEQRLGLKSTDFDEIDKNKNEANLLMENLTKNYNQVQLYLNKDEKEHVAFIRAYLMLVKNGVEKLTGENIGKEISDEDLIEKAQKVLKNAWEQAKNEKG